MRFWDTSGIAPLFSAERSSHLVRRWFAADTDVTVWALTLVELLSAFARRMRAEPARIPDIRRGRRVALRAFQAWTEITALEAVRRHAERLVEAYPLRAADAMQLGAAIVAAESDPQSLAFVTLDQRLAEAARREGFRVLGPA